MVLTGLPYYSDLLHGISIVSSTSIHLLVSHISLTAFVPVISLYSDDDDDDDEVRRDIRN